jgi:hypothetical protein
MPQKSAVSREELADYRPNLGLPFFPICARYGREFLIVVG